VILDPEEGSDKLIRNVCSYIKPEHNTWPRNGMALVPQVMLKRKIIGRKARGKETTRKTET
jgi:hypothetical protein